MKRCISLTLCLLLLVSLTACGKKPEEKNPTDQPTVTQGATPTDVPTPTSTPAPVITDRPLEAILNAGAELFRHNSFSINIDCSFENQDGKSDYGLKKKIIFDPDTESCSVYSEGLDKTDGNSERGYAYFYLKPDGGFYARAKFEYGIKYEIFSTTPEYGEDMYKFYKELFTPNGKPLTQFNKMMTDSFAEWPQTFLKDDEAFAEAMETLLLTYDNEDKLRTMFGYENEGNGVYSFSFNLQSINIPMLNEFLYDDAVATILEFSGECEADRVSDIEMKITIENGMISTIESSMTYDEKNHQSYKATFYDIGTTQYTIPENMRPDYENAKKNYKNMEIWDGIFSVRKNYYEDVKSGAFKKDDETLEEILMTYYYAIQDPKIKEIVMKNIEETGEGGEVKTLNIQIGDKVVCSGIPELDEVLKRTLKDKTLQLEAKTLQKGVLTIFLWIDEGELLMNYDLNY
ncbi:MAG: hypothetical protein J5643_10010 [Lachnospiraceae bacterium]|nr:hypothetical protein [Lachnospiraceae bacterium]